MPTQNTACSQPRVLRVSSVALGMCDKSSSRANCQSASFTAASIGVRAGWAAWAGAAMAQASMIGAKERKVMMQALQ